MCKPLEVLDHGPDGYVAYCPDCGGFTLAFGTSLIAMLYEDLHRLSKELGWQLVTHHNRVCSNAKAFMFRIDQQHTSQIVLTYPEMERLGALIQRGVLLFEAQSILHDLEN